MDRRKFLTLGGLAGGVALAHASGLDGVANSINRIRIPRRVVRKTPFSNRFGSTDEWNFQANFWPGGPANDPGQKCFDTLAGIGAGWIRYVQYWSPYTNPEPGVYNWAPTDRDINYLHDAGMNIQFIIPGGPNEFPVGKPVIHAPSWMYNSDYTYNAEYLKAFMLEAVKRYGNKVDAFTFFNEAYNGWPNDKMKELFEIVHIPAYDIVKEYAPHVPIWGPEEGGDWSLREMFEREKKTGLRLWDAITIHPYDDQDNYPAAMLKNLDEGYFPVFKQYVTGREIHVTETGQIIHNLQDPADREFAARQISEAWEGLLQRGYINKILHYGMKSGPPRTDGKPDDLCATMLEYDDTFTPTGLAIADVIKRHPEPYDQRFTFQ